MSRNLLKIAIVASIFGIGTSYDNFSDLKKLFNEILTQDKTSSNGLEHSHKLHHVINPYPKYSHGIDDEHNPNFNVEPLSILKKPMTNLDQYLRDESDRMCVETGRCGCSGTRCGDIRNGEGEEIAEIINEVKKQLDRESSSGDRSDESNVLRCDGDRCGYDRTGDGYDDKMETNDDGINIIIIDTQNLDSIDDELHDLKRNKEDLHRNTNNPATTYLSAPTFDEFVSHYKTVRSDVINQLSSYIQNNLPIPLKHLPDKQKQLLKTLKMNYQLGLVNNNNLKSKIVEIVFGDKSGTRIYPHNEDNDNIYVPRWHYNSLLQYKKDLRKKSLLPMTLKQKERLMTKKTVPKAIPKLTWRRRLDDNDQKYGAPFSFELNGLGQFNP